MHSIWLVPHQTKETKSNHTEIIHADFRCNLDFDSVRVRVFTHASPDYCCACRKCARSATRTHTCVRSPNLPYDLSSARIELGTCASVRLLSDAGGPRSTDTAEARKIWVDDELHRDSQRLIN